MKLLSDLYNLSSRGNIRGKSKQGYIRPTINQFLTPYPFFDIKNIISDYVWTASMLPTEAIYPFTDGGGYNTTLLDGALRFELDNGKKSYYRVITEATSDVGMTIRFEVRTNQNPGNWGRANCAIATSWSIIESDCLGLVITANGIYNWAGNDSPTNYKLMDCTVFNSFLWQISESNWKLFVNNGTSPVIDTPHTSDWGQTLRFGDVSEHGTSGSFAEWRLVGARPGIWDWNNF